MVAIGLPSPNRPADFSAAARQACQVLARAGSTSFAVALPPVDGTDPAAVARLWLEAGAAAPQARQVLLGEARTLLADLGAARAEAGVPVEIAPFAARPRPMVR